jgi:hypothetical protein
MHCYIVMTDGQWGRGKTLPEAAAQCHKSGGSKREVTYCELVVGDPEPFVDGYGRIFRSQESTTFRIGYGLKLGSLMRVITEPKKRKEQSDTETNS